MNSASRTTPVTDDLVARIADDLGVDPRTIIRRLAGLPVRGRCGARIDAALAAITAPPAEPHRAA